MRLAFRSLLRRPARSALAVAGVGLAIALAVTMFSLSEGVRQSTRDLVEASGVDVFLYPQGTNPLLSGNPNAPAGELAGGRALAARLEAEPGVRTAAPMLHEPVYVLAGPGVGADAGAGAGQGSAGASRVSDANTLGYVPETTREFIRPTFVNGSGMEGPGDVLVNANLARTMGLAPGDEVRLSLSPTEPTNERLFRVTGVVAPSFESPQEKTVYLHLDALQDVTGKRARDAVDFVGLKLDDPREADAIARRVEANHPVEAFTNDDLVGEVGALTSTFEGFARMIGVVTLAVALLFVSTVMMVVVGERTAEIGALRAIGMPRARVFQLILTEAALIVAVATILGFVLGWFGAIGFDAFLRAGNAERTPEGFRFTRFSWGLLAEVSALVALMGLVAGLVPAWRATRLNLLAALRSV